MTSPATKTQPTETDSKTNQDPFANKLDAELLAEIERINTRGAEIKAKGKGIIEPLGKPKPIEYSDKPLNLRPKTSFANMGIRGHYWIG